MYENKITIGMEKSVKNHTDVLLFHTASFACCWRNCAVGVTIPLFIAEPNLTFGSRFLRH